MSETTISKKNEPAVSIRVLKVVTALLMVIFFCGASGIVFRKGQVLDLIPFIPCLVLLLVVVFQPDRHQIYYFKIVLLLICGWAIEVMGVQGGILFGRYGYGHLLGSALIEVPLVTSVIWTLNVLVALQCTRFLFHVNGYWKTIMVASLLMTALDAFVQLPAVQVGFWSYSGESYPPWYHSLAYFGISLLMCNAAGEKVLPAKNFIAVRLAWMIPAFTLLLWIMLKIFW